VDYPKLFSEIHQRPGMYGLDGSYHDYCTYLLGLDMGNDRQLLVGFTELLVPRVGGGSNLTWTSLVLHLAFPGRSSGWAIEAAGDGKKVAVDLLFTLLDEFFETRSKHGGTLAIFDRYLTWLKAQSWYQG
jgi:hypothetical protein